jgi:homospermidine synthase
MSIPEKIAFTNKLVIIGFGSIGKALLPILFQNIDIQPSKITIITNQNDGLTLAHKFGIQLLVATILPIGGRFKLAINGTCS